MERPAPIRRFVDYAAIGEESWRRATYEREPAIKYRFCFWTIRHQLPFADKRWDRISELRCSPMSQLSCSSPRADHREQSKAQQADTIERPSATASTTSAPAAGRP